MSLHEDFGAPARKILSSLIKNSVALLGLKNVRSSRHDWSDTKNFIPFDSTIKAASSSGLSPGDYVDTF